MAAPLAQSDGIRTYTHDEAQALLRACFATYRKRLIEIAHGSLDQATDLFEKNDYVSEEDVTEFKTKRADWHPRFAKALDDLFERRLSGVKRKGRRPDFDASLASLRVLTAFDHEKQDALKSSSSFILRLTRRELDALDLRLELLLEGDRGDLDNPFGPAYILDAIGSTSRAVWPNARVWRPGMERLLADLTPSINKIYISLNRLLADRGVLPEIKAALRLRSEHRPADDRDLLPAFSKLLSEAGDLPTNVVVPEVLSDPNAPSTFNFVDKSAGAIAAHAAAVQAATVRPVIAPEIIAGLEALAKVAPVAAVPVAPIAPSGFGDLPSLDPLMALGTSTPLFNTLGRWQRLDLASALATANPALALAPSAVPAGTPVVILNGNVVAGTGAAGTAAVDATVAQQGGAATVIPLNLVPHIRTAIADQITNPADKITVDVIALLFDYIFRDPSIPDSLRALFSRLQVPIVKVALLDRTFFSDRAHPARLLLDHLAEGAVGAQNDDAYRTAFEAEATRVIDAICRDFEIDVTAFNTADAELAAFIEAERAQATEAMKPDVDAALAAEEQEADRSFTRALVRDKLAGLDLPFEVRSFAETTWADFLARLRAHYGEDSPHWQMGVATLDEMLWSIVAKERAGQKARLTKMIPGLVRNLRAGLKSESVPEERAEQFLKTLYDLHIAAIKPPVEEAQPELPPPPILSHAITNVHDYVSEMPTGTWLAFRRGEETVNARLAWVSPMRTKYIFTSRARRRAFVYSPEELAYQLGSGKAALVVEPVPLFDRAVSAALDTLATVAPPKEGEAAGTAMPAPMTA